MVPSALVTDLYELTMMAGYDAGGMRARATFELFVRNLPPNRAYLVAAGLEQALQYLETLRFTTEQIAYLRHLPNMRGVADRFFDDTLPALRFTGGMTGLPLLRPLIGMDKEEIVTLARRIGTFETSILPYPDCCTLFAPPHPLVRPDQRRMLASFAGLEAEELLEQALRETVADE